MAKYHGRNGAVLLASANGGSAASVANLTQWSLSIDMDTAEVSSLGDSFKSYVAGLKNASASVSGYWADDADINLDAFDQAQSGGTVNCYLYPAGVGVAKYWYGAVWPSGISIDDSVGGAVTFSGKLAFNGTCTRVG